MKTLIQKLKHSNIQLKIPQARPYWFFVQLDSQEFLKQLDNGRVCMELFAERVKFDSEGNPIDIDQCDDEFQCSQLGTSLRYNFDTWPNAMVFIFILLVGDDWNSYMFDYVRGSSKASIIFFISLTAFGNLILLNLFLAILLKDFEQIHDENEVRKKRCLDKLKDKFSSCRKKYCKRKAQIYQIKENLYKSTSINEKNKEKKFEKLEELNSDRPFVMKINENDRTQINFFDESTAKILQNNSMIDQTQKNIQNLEQSSFDQDRIQNLADKTPTLLQAQQGVPGSNNSLLSYAFPFLNQLNQQQNKSLLSQSDQNINSQKSSQQDNVQLANTMQRIEIFERQMTPHQFQIKVKLKGSSLFFLNDQNKFRLFIAELVKNKYFDHFILFLIILSTISLALEKPLSDPLSDYNKALYYCDMIFTILFGIECLFKVVAFGLVFNGKQSYLFNPWNILDLVILIFSFISLISNQQLRIVKSLRLMRTLRPLRMISKNEGLQIAIVGLINSISDILNVFIITLFTFFVYAIFGVNFFKGVFYYCDMNHLTEELISQVQPEGSFSKWECYNIGGFWRIQRSNFDNIFYGFLTLFQMSTTEGWVYVMQNGVDATDFDRTGIQDYNTMAVLYFITFILFGAMFIMNLFVGIVINTFKFEKEKLGLNYLLSDTQKEFVKVQIKCYKATPLPKDPDISNRFRRVILKIAQSKYFEAFIYVCISLNCIVLSINWFMMPEVIDESFDNINHSFTIIFTLEAFIKIISYGRQYFKEGWNIFDCITLLGTYAQIILVNFFDTDLGAQITVLRIFRIGRMFKLFRKAQGLQNIFATLLVTIPSLANIGFLFFLLIFIYAVIGINLFGKVKIHKSLNDYANFQNFWNAYLTLIRAATGEGWNDIMSSLMDQKSANYDCIDEPTYQDILDNNGEACGCGSYWTSLFYFISYMLLVTFIFLNLFIAIILEGFNDTAENLNLRVDDFMINNFKKIWQTFDPEGTGFIEVTDIELFFQELIHNKSNFIRGGEYLLKDAKEMRYFIAELQLPTYNKFKYYQFNDILNHLSRIIFKIDFDKIALLKQEKLPEYTKQNTSFQDLAATQKKHFVNNQDQLQFESFEELMIHFQQLVKKHKIALNEDLKKVKINEEKKRLKQRDHFKNNYYDSRVVVFMPILIKKLQQFTKIMKEKRKQQSDDQLKVQAQHDIMHLRQINSPQMIMARASRKTSVFTALAHSSKLEDKAQTLKSMNLKEENPSERLSIVSNSGLNQASLMRKSLYGVKLSSPGNRNNKSISETTMIQYKDGAHDRSILSNNDGSSVEVVENKWNLNRLNTKIEIDNLDSYGSKFQKAATQLTQKGCAEDLKSQDERIQRVLTAQINEPRKLSQYTKSSSRKRSSDPQPIDEQQEFNLPDDKQSVSSSSDSSSSEFEYKQYEVSIKIPKIKQPKKKSYQQRNKLQPDDIIQEEISYEETTSLRRVSLRNESSFQLIQIQQDLEQLDEQDKINNQQRRNSMIPADKFIFRKNDRFSFLNVENITQPKDFLLAESPVIDRDLKKRRKSQFAPASKQTEDLKEIVSQFVKKEKEPQPEIQMVPLEEDPNDLNEVIDMDQILKEESDSINANSQNANSEYSAKINFPKNSQENFTFVQKFDSDNLPPLALLHHQSKQSNKLEPTIPKLNYSQKLLLTFGRKSTIRGQSDTPGGNSNPTLQNQKKFSINSVAQFQLGSQNDLQGILDKRSSKRHSSRYQNIWRENEEVVMDFTQVADQANTDPLHNNHLQAQPKLRELLNVDIDSSFISSDLYQESESKFDSESKNLERELSVKSKFANSKGHSASKFQPVELIKAQSTKKTLGQTKQAQTLKLNHQETTYRNFTSPNKKHISNPLAGSPDATQEVESPIQTESSQDISSALKIKESTMNTLKQESHHKMKDRFWIKMAADYAQCSIDNNNYGEMSNSSSASKL